MANSFNKEERIAFETLLEGFEDACTMSRQVAKYSPEQVMMERTSDIIWRPVPYIAQSHDGTDATANFDEATQLSVPATIGYAKHSTAILTATELRDALQENRLGEAAKLKLASDINVAVANIASLQGTLVVKQAAAATGLDDVALIDAMMNEQGVSSENRKLFLSSRDYTRMASAIANSTRSFNGGKSDKAFEKGFVGEVLGFDTYKLPYANRIAAAGGGGAITIDTLAATAQYYVPEATSTAATGEVSNVDNRYQTVTVSTSAGVVAGDCFTIATCYACHHITKVSTGQLKTFRVISVPAGGTTLVISPPMINALGGSDAEIQYQNCIQSTPAANSAIVFLNTVAAAINPFWIKDAIEILPGRYAVPSDSGVAVMRGTTDQGIELVMQKFYDINTMKTKYRWDTRFGVVNKLPEHSGIILFSQT